MMRYMKKRYLYDFQIWVEFNFRIKISNVQESLVLICPLKLPNDVPVMYIAPSDLVVIFVGE